MRGKALPQTCQSVRGDRAEGTYACARINRSKPIQSNYRWNLEAADSEIAVSRRQTFIPIGHFLAKLR
jgi:hypothetical protein